MSHVEVTRFEAYVGSIVTGNTRAGSLNQARSGVSVSTALPLPCWVTVIATGETFGWSPLCGSTTASHATGAASVDATVPSAATNDTDPSFSGRAVNPLVFTGICHDAEAPARIPCSEPSEGRRAGDDQVLLEAGSARVDHQVHPGLHVPVRRGGPRQGRRAQLPGPPQGDPARRLVLARLLLRRNDVRRCATLGRTAGALPEPASDSPCGCPFGPTVPSGLAAIVRSTSRHPP